MIRAVVVFPTGMVTICEPSFGVFDARVVGNVFPPSVEYRMLTFAVLIGEPLVPATFHVTVCDEPPVHVTLVFGAVTAKARSENRSRRQLPWLC